MRLHPMRLRSMSVACARSWLVQWRYGPCEDSDMWSRRHLMSPAPKSASIRGRLLWHMALLFSVGLAALYWAASTYATYAADSSYDRLLMGSAASIAETLSITQDKAKERISVDIPYAALDMLAAAPNDRSEEHTSEIQSLMR